MYRVLGSVTGLLSVLVLLLLCISFVLSQPKSLNWLLSSYLSSKSFNSEIIFKEIAWHPFKPFIEIEEITVTSKKRNGPLKILLQGLSLEINILQTLNLQPISKLSLEGGGIFLKKDDLPSYSKRNSFEFFSLIRPLLELDYVDVNNFSIEFTDLPNSNFFINKISSKLTKETSRKARVKVTQENKGELIMLLKSTKNFNRKDYLRGYLKVENINLNTTPLNFFCNSCSILGNLKGEAWFSISNNKLNRLDGTFRVSELDSSLYLTDSIHSKISLIRNIEGPDFIFKDIIVSKEEIKDIFPDIFFSYRGNFSKFSIEKFNVENSFIKKSLDKIMPKFFDNLSLQGMINNLSLSLNEYSNPLISGKLDNLTFNLFNKHKIEGLEGKFIFDKNRFLFRSKSPQIIFTSNDLYKEPMEILDFNADIFGAQHDKGFLLSSKHFSSLINTQFINGSFSYYAFDPFDTRDLSILVQLNEVSHEKVVNLIPYIQRTKKVIDWANSYLTCGVVDKASALYRGPLIKFFEKSTQTFQMVFNLEDACISSSSLKISNIKASTKIQDSNSTSEIISADFLGSKLISDIKLGKFEKSSKSLAIEISGKLSGPFSTFSRLLLGDQGVNYSGQYKGSRIKGNQTTKFLFKSPFIPEQLDLLHRDSFLSLNTSINRGSLSFSKYQNLTEINSKIIYNNKTGIQNSTLSTSFNSVPFKFDLYTAYKNNQPFTYLSSRSPLSSDQIKRIIPYFSDYLKGRSEYEIDLELPGFIRGFNLTNPELRLFSSLEGSELNLPKPFSKKVDEVQSVEILISQPTPEKIFLIDFNYGEIVKGNIWMGDSVSKGLILLGDIKKEVELEENKLMLTGSLDVFDLDKYKYLFSNTNSIFNPEVFYIKDLNLSQAFIGPIMLTDTLVNMNPIEDGREFFLTNSELEGKVILRNNFKKGLTVNLESLKLENFYEKDKSLSLDYAYKIKFPIFFAVENLSLNESDLGSWKFNLTTERNQIVFDQLKGIYGNWQVGHIGNDENSRLKIENNKNSFTTYLNTKIYSYSPNLAFKELNIETNFLSEGAQFFIKSEWEGTPFDFNFNSFSGLLGFNLTNVLFEDMEDDLQSPSAFLRLVSIFNVTDTFEKVTNFNFTKLYKRGFNVDKVEGVLLVEKDNVLIKDPIVFKSGSSKFKWSGYANKSKEGRFTDLDLEVVMTLPLKDYLPAYALILGGPLTAGIVYIAGKAFEKRLDQLSSGKWRIWGEVEEPSTEFLGWFED